MVIYIEGLDLALLGTRTVAPLSFVLTIIPTPLLHGGDSKPKNKMQGTWFRVNSMTHSSGSYHNYCATRRTKQVRVRVGCQAEMRFR